MEKTLFLSVIRDAKPSTFMSSDHVRIQARNEKWDLTVETRKEDHAFVSVLEETKLTVNLPNGRTMSCTFQQLEALASISSELIVLFKSNGLDSTQEDAYSELKMIEGLFTK